MEAIPKASGADLDGPPLKTRGGFDPAWMLHSCRDFAADMLSRSLASMLDKIEEALFDLAEQAVERDLSNHYMDARSLAQSKRMELEREFRRSFIDGFEQRLSGGQQGASHEAVETGELSLVATDAFEEDLAVNHIATRLKHQMGEELNAFNTRIGHLLQWPSNRSDDHPLSPQVVVEAFRNACLKLEADLDVRLLVLKQFEQTAAQNVPNVYQHLNRFLIDRNILPTIPKLRFRRNAAGHPSPDRTFEAGSGSYSGLHIPSQFVGHEAELIGALHTLLSQNQASHQVGPAFGDGLVSHAPHAVAALPPSVGQSFLDALNHLQQGRLSHLAKDGFDEAALHNGDGNILRALKDSSLGQGLGHIDAITIDIVAMLFDQVFDDHHIPGPMKALIGRLQIPVLKVAMLDAKFFARKQHPTRQLLDGLAQAALAWQEQAGLQCPRYQKLAELIEGIVLNFDENLHIFEQSNEALAEFLQELEQQELQAASIQTDELAAAELHELACAQAASLIGERLQGELPQAISQFLLHHWQPVLAQALAVEGETEQLLQTADELIWSVSPKAGVEERLQLVNLLPRLLKRIESSLQQAGVAGEMVEAFFAELVHCHAQAIKAGLRPAEASPAPQPASQPAVPPQLPELDLGPASLDFSDADWQSHLPQYQDYDAVMMTQLQRGMWLSLTDTDGQIRRAKLSWISPRKSRYILTEPDGKGQTLDFDALSQLFREGRASLIDTCPAVEGAVSAIIGQLQGGYA